MKAIFINCSPRKNKNTAQMLESAMRGAQESGAEAELIHLQDLTFKGCVSCFACKRKGSTANGLCAYKDDLRPVLEKILAADVLVLGTPVYYSYPSGMFRNLMERLMFPILTYDSDGKGGTIKTLEKKLQTAIIYTMNCSRELSEKFNYPAILAPDRQYLELHFGHCEVLSAYSTYQFPDYSKYRCSGIDVAEREYIREHQFPIDLQNAFEMGKRLVEQAKAAKV